MKTTDCELCRRQVLSLLSHELRNPLAALGNSLYVLKWSQPGGAKAQRAMSTMERQIGKLSTLISALTDAARINEGKVELRLARIDLREIVRNRAKDEEHRFADRAVDLHLDLPAKPVPVCADPGRLAEVIGNLLDNAARFTQPGGKVLLAVAVDAPASRARITVHDSGIGLPEGLRGRLFEPFAQGDNTLARSRGGLGLGLVLVKGLVELHGGSVCAESDGPGRGSRFTVELPLAAEQASRSSCDR